MKKLIIVLITVMFLSGCFETHIVEVYQNGKKIDEVCSDTDKSRNSFGGIYYKLTTKKCEVK